MCVHVLVTGSDIIHEAFWWGFVVSRLAFKAGPLFVAGTKKACQLAEHVPHALKIYIYTIHARATFTQVQPLAFLEGVYAGKIHFFGGGKRGNIMFLFVPN